MSRLAASRLLSNAQKLEWYLKSIKAGEGFEKVFQHVNVVSMGNGCAKAEFTVDSSQVNSFRNLHGGYSATLVDIVSGIALLSHEKGGAGVSVNINMTYLQGASIGDEIIVEAKTIKTGKNLSFLEVQIKNKKTGDLLVTGTHTKFIGMG